MTDLKNLSIKELKTLRKDINTELDKRAEMSRENYQKKINGLIREIQEEGFLIYDEEDNIIENIFVQ